VDIGGTEGVGVGAAWGLDLPSAPGSGPRSQRRTIRTATMLRATTLTLHRTTPMGSDRACMSAITGIIGIIGGDSPGGRRRLNGQPAPLLRERSYRCKSEVTDRAVFATPPILGGPSMLARTHRPCGGRGAGSSSAGSCRCVSLLVLRGVRGNPCSIFSSPSPRRALFGEKPYQMKTNPLHTRLSYKQPEQL
jgi:hypothetical protein